jgi:dipeptidyl aminopeptidase/acylaminoacyl peptidase
MVMEFNRGRCRPAIIAVAMFAGMSATPSWAEAMPPIEVYGKLPSIEAPRLSPDGNFIALLSSVHGRRCLLIHGLGADHQSHGVCPGSFEVRSFTWKTSERLIVEVYSQSQSAGDELRTESKLVSVDLSGRNVVPLAEARSEKAVDFGQDRIVDILPADPTHVLIATSTSDSASPDVLKVDVENGRRRLVVAGQNRITSWKTDGAGHVRLGTAVEDGQVKIYYRDDDDTPFRLIRQVPAERASTFSVLSLSGKPGQLYVSSTQATGFRAVYPYDVATDRLLDAYASVPDADIDTLIMDRGQPMGFGYTIDEPTLVYTDPLFKSDADQVRIALPQFRTTVVDAAAGGQRLLILAAGGNRPGAYFLLTRTGDKATLEPIGAIRPEILDTALAPVTPVSYRARDGLTIHGYVTLPPGQSLGFGSKPLPFVVLPHGGPSARDALDFDYLAQMIASRGYGVFQPNYRGSRGYGGAFEEAGFAQWGLKMQDDVTDGTQWLIDKKYADPHRICIVGWSYGGYTALMGAIKTPDLYRCAASMAGVTDLRRRLDRANQSRFADLNLPRFDSDPAIIAANSPVLHADQIRIPILLVHGRRDFTVSVEDSEAMEAALRQAGKPVHALYFDDDDHYLFREDDRVAFLKAIDQFLTENLGQGVSAAQGVTATN